ncbi:hypothetical protein SUGI_1110070 [Cryptomeria japonica]|nr:hypothetical protein SUGI_1110070 [Cryptomeria japonica]
MVERGLACGPDGVDDGGIPVGCGSIQDVSRTTQKVEGGSSFQGGTDVGLDVGIQTEQHCRGSKGLDVLGVKNLKSLEDAKGNGWIEVKHKKGKRRVRGSICFDPSIGGVDGSAEVDP